MEIAAHYHGLGPIKPELLERIAHYVEKCPALISPPSVNALNTFPQADLDHADLAPVLKNLPVDHRERNRCGSLDFPVAATMGYIREIRLSNRDSSSLTPKRTALLDTVGSAVCSALQERVSRLVLWHPQRYDFVLTDAFEREDTRVDGDSMGLPLALALYSLITGTPVPRDVSATGRVMRDGTIRPVSSLKQKLAALERERWFVNRVLVSHQQKMDAGTASLNMIRVATLKEALDYVFPHAPEHITADIDLNRELENVKRQYDQYLIDTCIENTTGLIKYLEAPRHAIPKDRAVEALFRCYWRRGSCHCHKGAVQNTRSDLQKAETLYRENPGLILETDYWGSRINYAVLLKDIFRYKDAEYLHHHIQEGITRTGGLNHEKGKNIGSLSQLYLARGRFQKALDRQKEAMGMIREEDAHRNYGYLAQIQMRSGNLSGAKQSLKKASALLEEQGARGSAKTFYAWIFSEYLYRHIQTLKVPGKRHYSQVKYLLDKYPDTVSYVHALIRKFSGLAMILLGDHDGGLKLLEEAIDFFDGRSDPMLRLLGVSVRVEKSLWLIQKGQPENMNRDLRKIAKDLEIQSDIKHYFQKEIEILHQYLEMGETGPEARANLLRALCSLQDQIPY